MENFKVAKQSSVIFALSLAVYIIIPRVAYAADEEGTGTTIKIATVIIMLLFGLVGSSNFASGVVSLIEESKLSKLIEVGFPLFSAFFIVLLLLVLR